MLAARSQVVCVCVCVCVRVYALFRLNIFLWHMQGSLKVSKVTLQNVLRSTTLPLTLGPDLSPSLPPPFTRPPSSFPLSPTLPYSPYLSLSLSLFVSSQRQGVCLKKVSNGEERMKIIICFSVYPQSPRHGLAIAIALHVSLLDW